MEWEGEKYFWVNLVCQAFAFLCSTEALSSGQSGKIHFADLFQMLVSPEGVYAVLASCCCGILAGNSTLPIKKWVHVKLSFPNIIENDTKVSNRRKAYY